MKRIVKSRIFLVILTAIIVSSVTVYAVNIYNASQIDFEPTDKNWNVSKVDKALDELYVKANSVPTFGTPISNENSGGRTTTRSTNIELNKGKYILEVVSTASGGAATTNNASNYQYPIECSIECNKTHIFGKTISSSGSQNNTNTRYSIYFIEILTDNTIISAETSSTVNNNFSQVISLQASKIN